MWPLCFQFFAHLLGAFPLLFAYWLGRRVIFQLDSYSFWSQLHPRGNKGQESTSSLELCSQCRVHHLRRHTVAWSYREKVLQSAYSSEKKVGKCKLEQDCILKKTKKNTNNGIQECSYWESRRKSGEVEGAGVQILFEYYFLKNNSWWKTKTGDEIPRSSYQFPFSVCFELISYNPVLILFKLDCHKSKLWSSADCIMNNSTLKKLWFQKAFIVCSLLNTLPKIVTTLI